MAVVEEQTVVMIEGVKIPVDTLKPNPNRLEYGKLCATILPCFHLEDRCNNDETMSLDDLAPIPKINQRSTKLFRAAKDAADAAAEEMLCQKIEMEGRKLPLKKEPPQRFDSNVITPGSSL